MKYLQRAAQRLAMVGASEGAASMRPAIPSRSPLAEADQRLNLVSFAERFNEPLIPKPTAPMIEEEGAAATTPTPGRQPDKRQEAARPSASSARPAPPVPRPGVHSEPAKTERAGTKRRAVPPRAPARPGTQPPGRPARRANALPAPVADQGHALAPERARATSARVTGGAELPARDDAPQPMLDALSQAMSWVEGQPRQRPERERAGEQRTPAAVARPPFGESPPTRPARVAATRGRTPVTHLEIGRIEVEIVPPPEPAPQAAPNRTAPKTNGTGSVPRQPFGWRQR